MFKPFIRCSIALLFAAASLSSHAADPKPPMPVQEITTYQGADREERLLEGAKKEGEVTVYHAYPQLSNVTAAFTKKYGIKVKNWRSGSEAILQRVVSEARGKKFDVDIIHNNAPESEALHREGLIQPVKSPHLKDIMPAAIPAHGDWVGIAMDVYSAAYNTNSVKKEDLPKSYKDLLDPKWKGKLAVEAEDQGWFNTLVGLMGEQQGLKLFSDIVATNGISMRKGHSLLAQLVASGEVPLALSAYSWTPDLMKEKGAPIQGFLIDPVVAQFSSISMAKRAPHPYAAALFYDFMLTEGEKILADLKFVPTSKVVPSPIPAGTNIKYVDPVQALDNNEKWIKTFQNTMKSGK
ncbi:iron(III) transport system substrate-binding protein [Noviherbaspirillum humi]|uniref:Iron(III) transport system substrate-binding protein n=1 Tax=Noviherbaspirillum humi TaxID=1688639 RepID=A0A239JXD8_9BURK|nr:extracellular solute-binding protein [Noviherbaspirillum humi]SNT10128.1 iron(III) transport system substrate-binding protein [Noviherbaspirillum humi]